MRPWFCVLLGFACISTLPLALAYDKPCTLKSGVVIGNGNNLKQLTTPTASACCTSCNNLPNCGAFTFHTDGTGKCYLHPLNATGETPKPDRTSGYRSGPPTPPMACQEQPSPYPFCNTSLSLPTRISDLVSRIPSSLKPQILTARSPVPLPNLNIPGYYWGTNCVQSVENGAHGESPRCSTTKCSTHFPSPPGWVSSFNRSLMKAMAGVMGKELRALYNVGLAKGLDCWGPVININRDPRWGRNGEAGAEDPYLMGQFAAAWVDGFQRGEDPKYLMGAATLKHFDANSLEKSDGFTRHTYNVNVSNFVLADMYFPAFRAAIQTGGAKGVMCAYNSVQGIPSCLSPLLRNARKQWGFTGYTTSDSDAVADAYRAHHYVPTAERASCTAITQGGCDINSGKTYLNSLNEGVKAGECTETDVDVGVTNTLRIRFELGLFDPSDSQPYTRYTMSEVGVSTELNRMAAHESLVLLQNKDKTLPFTIGKSVAVIGPLANNTEALMGTHYKGFACPDATLDCIPSVLEAIRGSNVGGSTKYSMGSDVVKVVPGGVEAAVDVAKAVDYVVLVLGITREQEREGMDRVDIDLPGVQHDLSQAVLATGRPTVVILVSGGMVAVGPEKSTAGAILNAFLPGAEGARAIAHVIFGLSNPGGRLPYTLYPASFINKTVMSEMDPTVTPGRTYRYYTGNDVLFPFGWGLSFTTFHWEWTHFPTNPTLNLDTSSTIPYKLQITNMGSFVGDEVVLLYFTPPPGTARFKKQLFNFRRVTVGKGGGVLVGFEVGVEDLQYADERTANVVVGPGVYTLVFESGGPDNTYSTPITLTGSPKIIEPFPRV